MSEENQLTESETTIRFGMKIVAVNKDNGLYLSETGATGAVDSARKFQSVAAAKEKCVASGVRNYKILAYVPGAVSANSIVLAETGAAVASQSATPRFG